MMQPLRPVSSPAAVLSQLPIGTIPIGLALQYLLYAVFAFWAVYSIVIVYHWLKYSHDSRIAFPAIALHLFLSVALMAWALSGTLLV